MPPAEVGRIQIAAIEALAPDQASLNAASALRRPSHWLMIGCDQAAGLVWGECQGSGSAPYRTCGSIADLGYRCSCPSRKFPCKHALALFWRYAEKPSDFVATSAPEWVIEWQGRRRSSKSPATGDQAPPRAASAAAVETDDDSEAPDPAKAAAQRERLRASRERDVLAGLDQLDRWISDQLDRGLAQFPAVAKEQCRVVARRLADAKAPGLATLVDTVASDMFTVPDAERDRFLIERLGNLHLFCEAYRRQAELPPGLADDVRRMAGWTTKRQELLDDPAAPRADGRWTVLSVESTSQPDGLRRVDTWLARDASAEPRFGLLTEFFAAGAGGGVGLSTGDCFDGRLVFYPSSTPLRAMLETRAPLDSGPPLQAPESIHAALARFDGIAAANPFVDRWPLVIGPAHVSDTGRGYSLEDSASDALPVDAEQRAEVLPLLGLEQIVVAGVWNGRRLRLLAADTPLGQWYGS